MDETVKFLTELEEKTRKDREQLIAQAAPLVAAFGKALSPIMLQLQKHTEFIESFREGLENNKQLHQDLSKNGWFVAPILLQLPARELDSLRGMSEADMGARFSQLLSSNNYEILDVMVSTWSGIPQYEDRKSIIEQATQAHKEKRYELSVPALVLLFEGILKDVVGASGSSSAKHSIHTLFNTKIKKKLSDYEQFTQEQDLFLDLLVKGMFGSNVRWSRNSVAHNFLPLHATEINSTRFLLMLDKIFKDWN